MAKIKNVSPLGALVIPALGITVNAGATFDVDDTDIAKALLEQADNFAPGDKAAASVVAAATTTDDQSA